MQRRIQAFVYAALVRPIHRLRRYAKNPSDLLVLVALIRQQQRLSTTDHTSPRMALLRHVPKTLALLCRQRHHVNTRSSHRSSSFKKEIRRDLNNEYSVTDHYMGIKDPASF